MNSIKDHDEKLRDVYDRRVAKVESVRDKVTYREQNKWFAEYLELIREEVQLRYGKFREMGK